MFYIPHGCRVREAPAVNPRFFFESTDIFNIWAQVGASFPAASFIACLLLRLFVMASAADIENFTSITGAPKGDAIKWLSVSWSLS